MKNKMKSMVLVLLVVMSLMTVIFTYNRKKVTTKEEYIQEFKIDIVQFEQACNNVLNQVDHKNVNQVKAINGKQELMKLGIENNFLQKYGIECASITVKNGDIFVTFEFPEKIEGYEYAGIYYSSNGKIKNYGEEVPKEKDGKYIIDWNYYIYEAEKIEDNWFYYQCHWYHGI